MRKGNRRREEGKKKEGGGIRRGMGEGRKLEPPLHFRLKEEGVLIH